MLILANHSWLPDGKIIALPDLRILVRRGEVFEVDREWAEKLLADPETWAPADTEAKAVLAELEKARAADAGTLTDEDVVVSRPLTIDEAVASQAPAPSRRAARAERAEAEEDK